ncbi:MAG: DNA-protecting protein DprA, partial [Chromatiaceae bacterium]|nr:DNA-protecting protein DprA [Chromatiaceae bacterium]
DAEGSDGNPGAGGRGAGLDADYRRLLDAMGQDPAHVDLLVQRTGLAANDISSMLLMLELEGWIAASPGGRYSRVGGRGA